MAATFTVKPGAPTQEFEYWMPSGAYWFFSATTGTNKGPSYTTSDSRDDQSMTANLWLNRNGSTEPYVPPASPKRVQLNADGVTLEAVDGVTGNTATIPVEKTSQLGTAGHAAAYTATQAALARKSPSILLASYLTGAESGSEQDVGVAQAVADAVALGLPLTIAPPTASGVASWNFCDVQIRKPLVLIAQGSPVFNVRTFPKPCFELYKGKLSGADDASGTRFVGRWEFTSAAAVDFGNGTQTHGDTRYTYHCGIQTVCDDVYIEHLVASGTLVTALRANTWRYDSGSGQSEPHGTYFNRLHVENLELKGGTVSQGILATGVGTGVKIDRVAGSYGWPGKAAGNPAPHMVYVTHARANRSIEIGTVECVAGPVDSTSTVQLKGLMEGGHVGSIINLAGVTGLINLATSIGVRVDSMIATGAPAAGVTTQLNSGGCRGCTFGHVKIMLTGRGAQAFDGMAVRIFGAANVIEHLDLTTDWDTLNENPTVLLGNDSNRILRFDLRNINPAMGGRAVQMPDAIDTDEVEPGGQSPTATAAFTSTQSGNEVTFGVVSGTNRLARIATGRSGDLVRWDPSLATAKSTNIDSSGKASMLAGDQGANEIDDGTLLSTLDPRSTMGSSAITANQGRGVLVRARKSGQLRDLRIAVATQSGNVAVAIFDRGQASSGVRKLLWSSGSVATPAVGSALIGDPNVPVVRGQFYELWVSFDNATAQMWRAAVPGVSLGSGVLVGNGISGDATLVAASVFPFTADLPAASVTPGAQAPWIWGRVA